MEQVSSHQKRNSQENTGQSKVNSDWQKSQDSIQVSQHCFHTVHKEPRFQEDLPTITTMFKLGERKNEKKERDLRQQFLGSYKRICTERANSTNNWSLVIELQLHVLCIC